MFFCKHQERTDSFHGDSPSPPVVEMSVRRSLGESDTKKSRSIPLFVTALILGCTFAVAGEQDSGQSDYRCIVSNDGDAALMVRTPEYQAAANTDQHIGIVPYGTEVEVIEERPDPSLPVMRWSRVRVCEGHFEGRTGWMSSRVVKRVRREDTGSNQSLDQGSRKAGSGAQPATLAKPALGTSTRPNTSSDRTTASGPGSSTNKKRLGKLIKSSRLYSRPSLQEARTKEQTGELRAGTPLEILAEQRESAFSALLWFQISVTEGSEKGKSGWVLGHYVHPIRPRTRCAIIASPGDSIAAGLATHPDIELVDTRDLEPLVRTNINLSTVDEVIIVEHGESSVPGTINSGDSPRSLAGKLRKAQVGPNTPIELLVCNGGSPTTFLPNRHSGTFAGELAAQLGRSVIAYPHYITVKTNGCTSLRPGCLAAKVTGYEYAYDAFAADRKGPRRDCDSERCEYGSDGSETPIGGQPLAIKKNNLK